MLARNTGYHGIALSGQASASQRRNGVIERCTVETTRRDGIHMTAQTDFRIDRNWVRDPSNGNPGAFAAIHVARQGGTTLENVDGTGTGNVVVLSGATTPLGGIVIRPQSINVVIDGVARRRALVRRDLVDRRHGLDRGRLASRRERCVACAGSSLQERVLLAAGRGTTPARSTTGRRARRPAARSGGAYPPRPRPVTDGRRAAARTA